MQQQNQEIKCQEMRCPFSRLLPHEFCPSFLFVLLLSSWPSCASPGTSLFSPPFFWECCFPGPRQPSTFVHRHLPFAFSWIFPNTDHFLGHVEEFEGIWLMRNKSWRLWAWCRRERRKVNPRKRHISWAPTVCHASQNAEHLTNDMSLDHRILPHQIRKPRLQRFL